MGAEAAAIESWAGPIRPVGGKVEEREITEKQN
jgi:hypothetical protein